MTASNQPPVVMIIAGNDPTGGAGLCADIQTLAEYGCHALPVISALTVQDTMSVKRFQGVDSVLFQEQMLAVFEDVKPRAVKTGMLANAGIVEVIVNTLENHRDVPIIVDPVIRSNMDDSLSERSLISSIREHLMPLATLITPNIPEVSMLAGKDAEIDECVRTLGKIDCLVTGTHDDNEKVINRFYRNGNFQRQWQWPRLQHEYHGSGCTLASAIAAGIALGDDLETSIDHAQDYVMQSLRAAFKPGSGQHIPNRCRKNLQHGE
jgi:hydroxymethylpyrimidine/phosphomethylpyrimidine kinase